MIFRRFSKVLRRLFRPLIRRRELLTWASTISPNSKDKRRIVADYIQLYRKKGLTTEEYYEMEFEKQDESFRQSFLGLNEQRVYLDYLNPVKYYSLARNKYLTHKILEGTGIRMSALYCYYQPEARCFTGNECAGDLEGVLNILKSKCVQSCVIKTTETSHGDNVCVINNIDYQDSDAEMIRYDGKVLLLSSVLGQDPLIFE